ncbi:MAG: response regulator, partial [Pseudomonas sp.]|nr:response regulator [Pseudomonas sp.]
VREVRDKDVEGVGLGLAIVKRLGRLMGLEVSLRSHLGHGTCVTLKGLSRACAQVSRATVDQAVQAGLLTGLRVCLVEDDDNVLQATSALLQRWGCEVQAECSPFGLVSDCDVIVADYDLGPQATGIDCIDQLRAQRGADVPALIMTGHDIDRLQGALQARGIAVLAKPVRPAELRAALRALGERGTAPVVQADA